MNQQTKTALAIFGLVIAAVAFWMILISPKRNKADELSAEVTAARSALTASRQQAAAGLAAKQNFSSNYQQLVVLGKAVPADSGTASLLVQLNHVGTHAHTRFLGIELNSEGEEAEGGEEAEESIASLPPLGSKSGPAGLQAMSYELNFEGGFFDAADFIERVNSLVETKEGRVRVDGRLLTFDGISITAAKSTLRPRALKLKFIVTAYATPPGQGLTAGATPTGPAPE